MIVLSATDLQLASPLSHLTELQIVSPEYDHLVMPILEEMGCDLDYGICISASQHRNLQNKVVVSYTIACEVGCNWKHLSGPFGTAENRMLAASHVDASLSNEMALMQSVCNDFQSLYSSEQVENQYLVYNEDEQEIAAKIAELNKALYEVRGEQVDKFGNYRTYGDYHV